MTRILGIDPGSRITGYGIIEVEGNRSTRVHSGHIVLHHQEFPGRLRLLFETLRELSETWQPQETAIEKVFMHRNPDSALKLGQARGAALCAVLHGEVEVFEYSPKEIKQAVTGKGGAAKEQVQHMVRALLALPALPQADEADALAVALCHGHLRQTLARVPGVHGTRAGRLR